MNSVKDKEELTAGAPPEAGSEKYLNRLWWQIGALLAVSAIAVFTGSYFDRQLEKFMPETRILSSTYNGKASGLQALSDLTDKLGKPSRAWELPYRQLPGKNGTLLIVSPVESLKEFEVDQILKWVKRGNTLIYLDDFSLALSRIAPTKLGLKAKLLGKEIKNEKFEKADFGSVPEFSHVDSLKFSAACRLEGGSPIVSNKSGVFMTTVGHGKGRVLIGCCPDFCANRTIAKQDYWGNFQFLQNYFGGTTGGTVFFDERVHGYSGGTNVFLFLSRGPVGAISFQVLLILLIAVISGSQRFGAAQSIDERRRISNLEFINGLSNAYRRARANPAVAEILFQEFRKKLARTLGVSPHEPIEKLTEAWQELPAAGRSSLPGGSSEPVNLEKLIGQYEEFMSQRDVSDAQLKSMVASCDKITEKTQDKHRELPHDILTGERSHSRIATFAQELVRSPR